MYIVIYLVHVYVHTTNTYNMIYMYVHVCMLIGCVLMYLCVVPKSDILQLIQLVFTVLTVAMQDDPANRLFFETNVSFIILLCTCTCMYSLYIYI